MTCSLLNGLYHVRAGPGGGEGGRLGGSERGGGLRSERGGWSAAAAVAAAAAAAARQQLCGVDQLVPVKGGGGDGGRPLTTHNSHIPFLALTPSTPPLALFVSPPPPPHPPSLSFFSPPLYIHVFVLGKRLPHTAGRLEASSGRGGGRGGAVSTLGANFFFCRGRKRRGLWIG